MIWPFKQKEILVESRASVAVRMEAIGGQGANAAGKILAEAAVLGMDYSGNHFSSFGSEKRGSPVKSFVRFSPAHQPIRSASFIENPDLLIIFHENILFTPGSILGTHKNTDLIINSPKQASELKIPTETPFRNILTINATALAAKHQCGLNVILLGAASLLLPEVSFEVLSQKVEEFFKKLSATKQKANMAGFKAGKEFARIESGKSAHYFTAKDEKTLPQLGWLNAPIGGLVINPGNTILKDNSVSRKGVVPKYLPDTCIQCGFCDMVCPDYCFVWDNSNLEKPNLKGIDYQFCKACQKCISICPVNALVPTKEETLSKQERQLKKFAITSQEIAQKWRGLNWEEAISHIPVDMQMLTLQTELLNPNTYIKPDFTGINIPSKDKKDEGSSD